MRARLLPLLLLIAVLVPPQARAGVVDPVRVRFDVGAPAQLALGQDPDRLTFVHGVHVGGGLAVDLAPALGLTLTAMHQSFVYRGPKDAAPGLTLDEVEDASVSAVLLGFEARKRVLPGVTAYLGIAGGPGFFGGGHRHYTNVDDGTKFVARGLSDSAPAYAAAAGLRMPVPWLKFTLDLGWQGLDVHAPDGSVKSNSARVGIVL